MRLGVGRFKVGKILSRSQRKSKECKPTQNVVPWVLLLVLTKMKINENAFKAIRTLRVWMMFQAIKKQNSME